MAQNCNGMNMLNESSKVLKTAQSGGNVAAVFQVGAMKFGLSSMVRLIKETDAYVDKAARELEFSKFGRAASNKRHLRLPTKNVRIPAPASPNFIPIRRKRDSKKKVCRIPTLTHITVVKRADSNSVAYASSESYGSTVGEDSSSSDRSVISRKASFGGFLVQRIREIKAAQTF